MQYLNLPVSVSHPFHTQQEVVVKLFDSAHLVHPRQVVAEVHVHDLPSLEGLMYSLQTVRVIGLGTGGYFALVRYLA